MVPPYLGRRLANSRFIGLRGLRYHRLEWGTSSPDRPTLLMLHGWMDVAASFQFVVDAMRGERHVVALDWRGFGLTQTPPAADSYAFADYLGDLDAAIDALAGDRPLDLAGHSMGGNVAMIYAGVRPGRIRRLVNLEGFGMPQTSAQQAPKRYAQWLDELKARPLLRDYASRDEVAERLMKNNPRLGPAKAAWLSAHWAEQRDDGRWHILGDPAHKRVNPVLYRKDEVLECWKRIEAPVLWVEGDSTDTSKWWGDRYPRSDFESRLAVVPRLQRERLADCGHRLHHDQPEALAALLESFLLP